jgi:hypothetical protein
MSEGVDDRLRVDAIRASVRDGTYNVESILVADAIVESWSGWLSDSKIAAQWIEAVGYDEVSGEVRERSKR